MVWALKASSPFVDVGGRDSEVAMIFMDDLAKRPNRVQLTSDGRKAYLEAVEGAFGSNIDRAVLVKGSKLTGLHRNASAATVLLSASAQSSIALKGIPIPGCFDQLWYDAAHECLFKKSREPRSHDGDFMQYYFVRIHQTLWH